MTYFAPKSISDDDDEREVGVSDDAFTELDDDGTEPLEEDDDDDDYVSSFDDHDDY